MKINIALLYSCDPLGPLIGGVESFIKGVISTAPDNISYSVIGATTDAISRPIGQWTTCELGDKTFRYFPLYAIKNKGKRSKIPHTVLYELAAIFRMPDLFFADIIESHRIEHLLIHARKKPFNLFMHQNMAVLNNAKADIRWKTAPGLYRFLEKKLVKRIGSVSCVRADAVEAYQEMFPEYAEKFRFQPTWMDENIFSPVHPNQLKELKNDLCAEFNLDEQRPIAVAVGRIDSQKDPLLMVEAFACMYEHGDCPQLIWVGDGVMRAEVEQAIKEKNISSCFKIAGLRNSNQIADILRASDFFIMSSAYEGMPIAVLEALACGCPVVSTRVGEVPRLVEIGRNGYLAEPGDCSSLVKAVELAMSSHSKLRGDPCIKVAEQHRPAEVLVDLYKRYEQLCN